MDCAAMCEWPLCASCGHSRTVSRLPKAATYSRLPRLQHFYSTQPDGQIWAVNSVLGRGDCLIRRYLAPHVVAVRSGPAGDQPQPAAPGAGEGCAALALPLADQWRHTGRRDRLGKKEALAEFAAEPLQPLGLGQFLDSFGDQQVEKMTLGQASRAVQIAARLARLALSDAAPSAAAAPAPIQLEIEAALKKAFGARTDVTESSPASSATLN